VSLVHLSNEGVINWVGLESFSPAAITEGRTAIAGTHIVFIDFNHKVDIRVGATADTILIHNAASFTETGNVTLVW
jgi:hypothetical protein